MSSVCDLGSESVVVGVRTDDEADGAWELEPDTVAVGRWVSVDEAEEL